MLSFVMVGPGLRWADASRPGPTGRAVGSAGASTPDGWKGHGQRSTIAASVTTVGGPKCLRSRTVTLMLTPGLSQEGRYSVGTPATHLQARYRAWSRRRERSYEARCRVAAVGGKIPRVADRLHRSP